MGASAILAAAGRSERMDGRDKLFLSLNGKSVLRRSLEALLAADCITEVVIACAPQRLERVREMLAQMNLALPVVLTTGGDSRQASVLRALEKCSCQTDCIMVHDAARPLVCPEDIDRLYHAVIQEKKEAAALGVPVKDTVKLLDENGFVEKTPPRDRLYAAQTPQAFSAPLYRKAVSVAAASGREYTDDCQLVEAIGVKVYMVPGDFRNLKITTPEDLQTALAFLKEREPMVRIGNGYDVHRLAEGRRLVLGGVEIVHPTGLLGHSDADVLLHAVMDAMLGAAALGDIGSHFPDGDDTYRDIDSRRLLRQTAAIIKEHGFEVGNLDAVIVAQKPKLAPYLETMRQNIAQDCEIPSERVSVKATTEEHLGFTGRQEGIAAHAVCLLQSRER